MKYRIIDGNFDMGGGVVAQTGEVIELEPDVAALHRHRLVPAEPTPAPAPPVQTPAQDHEA